MSRGPYKRHECDWDINVPRTTTYNRRKRQREHHGDGDGEANSTIQPVDSIDGNELYNTVCFLQYLATDIVTSALIDKLFPF